MVSNIYTAHDKSRHHFYPVFGPNNVSAVSNMIGDDSRMEAVVIVMISDESSKRACSKGMILIAHMGIGCTQETCFAFGSWKHC